MPNNDILFDLDEPTPTRKKTHWGRVLLAITGVVMVLCVAGAVFGNHHTTATTATVAPTSTKHLSPTPKHTAGIGEPVRDGKFEFVVNKIDCNHTKLGDSILGSTAQGKYCLINMSVKNIGSEPQILTGGWQEAYSADGKKYSDDAAAELYANNNDDPLLSTINPGNTVTGNLVYDIPQNAAIVKLKLHDSPFSDGAWVAILA